MSFMLHCPNFQGVKFIKYRIVVVKEDIKKKNIARVQNCPDVTILINLFGQDQGQGSLGGHGGQGGHSGRSGWGGQSGRGGQGGRGCQGGQGKGHFV